MGLTFYKPSSSLFTMQIPRPKYKQGLKIVEHHKSQPSFSIPSVNQDLRRIGFSNKEIEFFWTTTTELKIEKLHQKFQEEMMVQLAEIENEPELDIL